MPRVLDKFFVWIYYNLHNFLIKFTVNILGNAMKFTDKGHILMRARTKEVNGEVELCVEVEDTGIGIHPDKHEVIFNPFERDDSQAARTLGGTGLGLYLAKKMAHMMRGDIWFKSEVVSFFFFFVCCLCSF